MTPEEKGKIPMLPANREIIDQMFKLFACQQTLDRWVKNQEKRVRMIPRGQSKLGCDDREMVCSKICIAEIENK